MSHIKQLLPEPGEKAWRQRRERETGITSCFQCGGFQTYLEQQPDGDWWHCDDCDNCWQAETIMGRREPWMDL